MGFEKDKLGRKEYADILTEIIGNPEKYKRNSDSDSFTMAIDSSWGTGKTEFLKMWEEELKEQRNEDGNNKYIVISYNSWKNDFAKNPLESVIYSILTNKVFNKINDKENGKEGLKSVFETIIKFTERALPGGKVLEAGIEGVQEIGQIMDRQTCMDDILKEYENYINMLDKVKVLLEKITSKTKIIVMIDELDRCKPLFAIRLLETIKHIFNVENMIFVFALDMTQLSYSVKKVYGSEIDAAGYICRFFDYITKMPKPDTSKYIEYLMEKKPLIRKNFGNLKKYDFYGNIIKEQEIRFIDMLQECVENYQLSLRDINTVYSNFAILEERELKDIDNGNAYALYLLLLIIKYKNLELFNKIFIKHHFVINDEMFLQKIKQSKYFNINAVGYIKDNMKIKDKKFLTQRGNAEILNVDIQTKQYRYLREEWEYREKYDNKTELAPYFFYSDIENYNNIKEMGIADYIHKKLELFNFEWEQKQETGE